MVINTKLGVGEIAFYISHQGKIMSNAVESIDIRIGSSTYRTDTWLGTAKTDTQVVITYKLENQPAGYILTEDSVHKTKEDLLGAE